MDRDVTLPLYDIRDAIDGIGKPTATLTFDTFKVNWIVCRGVERGLEIISEVSRRVTESMKAGEPTIPWRKIAAIGNVLRHDYDYADAAIVWKIVQDDLPLLRAAVERLIAT